jgi:hypothetical protein
VLAQVLATLPLLDDLSLDCLGAKFPEPGLGQKLLLMAFGAGEMGTGGGGGGAGAPVGGERPCRARPCCAASPLPGSRCWM